MTKLTEEELKEINELRNKIGDTVNATGEISLRMSLLDDEISAITIRQSDLRQEQHKLTTKFKQLLTDEETLVQRFLTQYGAGSIDFDTGEFTPEK